MEQEHDAEGEVYLDGDPLVPGHALLQQTWVGTSQHHSSSIHVIIYHFISNISLSEYISLVQLYLS